MGDSVFTRTPGVKTRICGLGPGELPQSHGAVSMAFQGVLPSHLSVRFHENKSHQFSSVYSINVHLGIFTMALAVGTTMSGFFGMNLVSGLEEAQWAFPIVVATSSCSGGLLALYAWNYMSGRTMQLRAEQRLKEIETLNAALSDMGALDYAVSL